jgi:hypothetical protein
MTACPKKLTRRTYQPRVFGGRVVMTDASCSASDETREPIEMRWPELVHKLPPKTPST